MDINTLGGMALGLLSAGGVFAVLRTKVDAHHKVLFSEHGELQFQTKDGCKEKHVSELKTVCLKLEVIKTEVMMLQANVNRLLDRLEVDGGRRAYDPKIGDN